MADWFTAFTEEEEKKKPNENNSSESPTSPTSEPKESNWFDQFESNDGDKSQEPGNEDDDDDSSWIDMPLEWMTGRKSRGLTLEMYDHEHHLFELAHEGVIVISEEGIVAAYNHLTHDALIAIAKAHIRFGIVEVHDYDENEERPFAMSKSGSFRETNSFSEKEQNKDFEKKKKKRMTTAEVNAEAEIMVAQWEKKREESKNNSSSIPGWFMGHIERLGFVPASTVVGENDQEESSTISKGIKNSIIEEEEDDEEKEGEENNIVFEKGHSVCLIDSNHEKIPQNTEGTILMIMKDTGKIMVNFPGYGVAPLDNHQLKPSTGKADGEVLDQFLQASAADVDNIGNNDNSTDSVGGGAGGEKKKGFWKWIRGVKSDDPRAFGRQERSRTGSFASFFRANSNNRRSFFSPFSPKNKKKDNGMNDNNDDLNRLTVGGKDDFNLDEEDEDEEDEEDFEEIRRRREAHRDQHHSPTATTTTTAPNDETISTLPNDDGALSSSPVEEESGASSGEKPSRSSTVSFAASTTPPQQEQRKSSTGKEHLPYGGDLREAMKNQDRNAIREIMAFNQKAMADNGGVAPVSADSNKVSDQGDESGGGGSGEGGGKMRKSHRKSRHYHHHHHHHKGDIKQQLRSKESMKLEATRDEFHDQFGNLPGFMPDSAKRMTMGLMDFLDTINPSAKKSTEVEYYSSSCSDSSSGSETDTSASSSSSDEETDTDNGAEEF